MQENLQKIKELFNAGKLTVADAEWYNNKGYLIDCYAGMVQAIIPPFMDTVRKNNREMLELC